MLGIPDTFIAEIETNPEIDDIDIEKYDSYRFKYFIEASNMSEDRKSVV